MKPAKLGIRYTSSMKWPKLNKEEQNIAKQVKPIITTIGLSQGTLEEIDKIFSNIVTKFNQIFIRLYMPLNIHYFEYNDKNQNCGSKKYYTLISPDIYSTALPVKITLFSTSLQCTNPLLWDSCCPHKTDKPRRFPQ